MKINPKNLTTMPDVTKTPSAPTQIPIPYPTTAGISKVSSQVEKQVEKQSKQVTQSHTNEQKLSAQQVKSQLSRLANGELPKAIAFLNSAPPKSILDLPQKIQKDLSAIGKSLDPANPGAILDKFGAVVGKAGGPSNATNVKELVQHVLRESYRQTSADLSSYQDKMKSFNEMKRTLRNELEEMRSTGGTDSWIKKQEEKLNALGDDAQLANVDLQNILQRQQQTLQQMSSISKMLYDTAQSVIRKIGG